MEAATIRSGLTESIHPWSAVAIIDGELHTWGDDVDRIIFARSTAKPIQATICQEFGAAMSPEQMAIACSSHSGWPVQLAMVESMLNEVGLDTTVLQTTAGYPYGVRARQLAIRSGAMPQPIFNNCSGKHASFLRACVAKGWPTSSYLSPDHPLQQAVIAWVRDITGEEPLPHGTDGCGAPTLRTTLAGIARSFSWMSSQPTLPATVAMRRYPALTAGPDRPDGLLARWWDGPVKVGAEGSIGLGRNGVAIAVKSHEGRSQIAVLGAIEIADRLGLLQPHVKDALHDIATPSILGGGVPVGAIVPDRHKAHEYKALAGSSPSQGEPT